jgi:hypothetical protein
MVINYGMFGKIQATDLPIQNQTLHFDNGKLFFCSKRFVGKFRPFDPLFP